ncbi:ATP-grasp domain-containing protein [Vibrio gazogenes]|uniref:Biotin carboxylase n=1 Tax=Vibrio gazogenes DSM 21264 = NBRC 103151 TaxID=1123492 RepID=A0A1M4YUF8_VIBGA|nr:ATP-grasp domain-containing protein [Vibrio gazogenes]USP15103.1 ATP-grasp domain-containing protein [Vibrio gazogenes]SHF09449.1 Biotin carboxylase [Vibrio gazogenes DSM 21264] [Vibrio gazogenes DSM 21264 = NBRC 103151]SJN56392.1 Alanine-anticapsin ligase BacD [Vibrio gazogenes]
MPNHIVFIGAHGAMCDCVEKNEIRYTLIDKPDKVDTTLISRLSNCFLFDYENDEFLLRIINSINDEHPITAVVSLTESGLLQAAKASEYLELHHTKSETVMAMKDKAKMRMRSNNVTDFPVGYNLANRINDYFDFSSKYGYPFIAKPKDGVGSVGVRKISSKDEISSAYTEGEMLLESFIEGKELSVETFSFSGVHHVVAITEKEVLGGINDNQFTEIGHKVPAGINDEEKKLIIEFTNKFLNSLEYKDGPAHTEIKIQSNKVSVIETHNRIGGDRISDLVKLSTGVDLVELSILWPLGMCKPVVNFNESTIGSAIRFFSVKSGVVNKISGLHNARCLPGVVNIELNLSEGDVVQPITNSFNRYGFVIATGLNADEADKNCKRAIDSIVINIS